jgi:hypothetical protein
VATVPGPASPIPYPSLLTPWLGVEHLARAPRPSQAPPSPCARQRALARGWIRASPPAPLALPAHFPLLLPRLLLSSAPPPPWLRHSRSHRHPLAVPLCQEALPSSPASATSRTRSRTPPQRLPRALLPPAASGDRRCDSRRPELPSLPRAFSATL